MTQNTRSQGTRGEGVNRSKGIRLFRLMAVSSSAGLAGTNLPRRHTAPGSTAGGPTDDVGV